MPCEDDIPDYSLAGWFHSDRCPAQAACQQCGGVLRHETWCGTHNPEVLYAHKIVLEASALTLGDAIILHSLGAAWSADASVAVKAIPFVS